MNDLNGRVGIRIKRRRLELGLSQRELVRKAGLSVAFLSDVERGKRGISVESLVSLAGVLGRRLDWFVADRDDAYGRCPHCGGRCVERERRLTGNDRCEQGHVYPSKAAVKATLPERSE